MSQFYEKLLVMKKQNFNLEITTADGKNHHCEEHWEAQEYDGKVWILYTESKGKVQFFNLSQATSLNFINYNLL